MLRKTCFFMVMLALLTCFVSVHVYSDVPEGCRTEIWCDIFGPDPSAECENNGWGPDPPDPCYTDADTGAKGGDSIILKAYCGQTPDQIECPPPDK